jgi:hypothetical protein
LILSPQPAIPCRAKKGISYPYYDPKAEQTLEFFSIVQNKLHWAIAGKTAAEFIMERAGAGKPNMGLTKSP